MSNQQGIDRLLQAEQEATETVQRARKAKAARIKQARDEAAEEINKYRQQLEMEYQKVQSSGMTISDKSARLNQETEGQLMEIRRSAEANRVNVVRQILAWVSSVDTNPPK
ncbi:hypothetical protein GUITHDRAFT_165679 [Guillardia theta CCMP2712]|uniref:V-type proton ATPase subunit G n=1 Tax=Guillardia theta (strain CCMP2712) TaxID=905079 RepID=L1IL36_GUITC|nr:hypothetical protein GUITHDRAFT_165679 [Guillardia theta CCMP2712]EKX36624.1 hypothetical protein GUITHDRAFT_165679 [Guillardia theta CCMP2712]|eukprot:XP_005823604.1 hypothetical protein GUITHDRAFT_165679 [Guillardia theta CCMP2712]